MMRKDTYEEQAKAVAKEVEKILLENIKSQGVYIEIGLSVGECATLSFEVKNRFPTM